MADTATAQPIFRTTTQHAHRKGINVATLIRWITRGTRARNGDRIRLVAQRLGGRWSVSDEALEQFIEAVTADRLGEPAPPPRTPKQRTRAAEAAGRALEKLGC